MKLLTAIIAICFTVPVFSQGLNDLPKPRHIDKKYRKEYKELIQQQREAAKAINRWDINLDPIEEVPTMRFAVAPEANENWGNKLLLPPEVWTEVKNRAVRKVVIKIGDTGEPDHSDLKRGLMPGVNYTGDTDKFDGHGHSTHVGGIVGANGFGLADPLFATGLAQIKYCKVLNNSGSGSFTWIANMIATEDVENKKMIADGTAVVINFSLGGGTAKVDVVETALKNSTAAGVVYCVAAGNTGQAVNFPGNSTYVTGVSSLDESLTISSFSSRGPEVEQTAPGRNIYSTYKNNGYATLSGTSMATPFQTALTAIAMSIYPSLNNQASVDAYFQKISTDLGTPGKDNLYGWGLAYVRKILDTPPTGTPPVKCDITTLAFVGEPSACNDNGTPITTDDWFTQDVNVVSVNHPTTGNLQLAGGDHIGTYSVPVSSLIHGAYTFKAVKFKADGTPTTVVAEFTADPACLESQIGAIVKPCSVQPPPDTVIVRPKRTLCIPVDGEYKIYWTWNNTASASGVYPDEPVVFDLTLPMEYSAYQTITVTLIEANVFSTTNADIEVARLEKNVAWFFKNRGLGLPKGSDFADAIYWTAYFLDMLLDRQATVKQDISITRIIGNDENGNRVIYQTGNLREWTPTKK